MNGIRLSIAQLMVAVAVIGAAAALILKDETDQEFYRHWHDYLIGVLPMTGVLAFGLATGLIGLLRKGECRPFVVGFEVTGWALLYVYASFLAVNYHWRDRTLVYLAPVTQLFFPDGYAFTAPRVMALHMILLFIPELLLSLIGGLLSTRLGVTVVRTMDPAQRNP